MRLFHKMALLFAIVPPLGACSSLGIEGVTCTLDTTGVSCGVSKTSGQDPLATQGVAENEKPVRTFEKSSSRFEETPP
jgi:hypothetical protein